MKSRRLVLSALSLLGVLLGSAQAQDLGAYRSMAAALERAVADRPNDRAVSLADLDAASQAYAKLRPGIKSGLLTGGIDRALDAARAALSRTPADLEAQVVQARSLMRKALHDQTLSLINANPQSAAVQSGLLANEFGLPDAERAAFLKTVAQGQADRAARLLRSAAARKVQASLAGAVTPQNDAQRAQTYLALARATGWFTVVQDAPDTGGLKLDQLKAALTQLTATPSAPGLSDTLGTLKREAAAFVRVSSGAASSAQVPQAPVTQAPATQNPATQVPATQNPATQTPASPNPAAQNPAAQNPAASPPAARSTDAVYAELGRALTAAAHSDAPGARAALGQASRLLGNSPLSSLDGFATFASDLGALQGRSGLRASDVQALIAELAQFDPAQGVKTSSALDGASAAVSRSLGAPAMPLLFLLVGLLAIYPLYLLNLAFGGRNAYWRAIAAALVLLFLPALLEGLSGTLLYLGDLSGLGALRSLGNLSLHQGAWGLPVWWLLTALAVGLASYGFRGLCRQFGLLGVKRSNPASRDPGQSALDWDEEV
ncbi:hypothetical protein [Deinococcus sp.]|uniref:hypothetical protein n=1 Tax=Deinococcus sp. TaxID=47478 RepID=UPI003CC6CB6C